MREKGLIVPQASGQERGFGQGWVQLVRIGLAIPVVRM